ncbi:hypothetical protein D3C87_1916600 [compost metagenome]
MFYDLRGRDGDELAIGGPADHRNRRNDADGVTGNETVDAFADRLYQSSSLEAETTG